MLFRDFRVDICHHDHRRLIKISQTAVMTKILDKYILIHFANRLQSLTIYSSRTLYSAREMRF